MDPSLTTGNKPNLDFSTKTKKKSSAVWEYLESNRERERQERSRTRFQAIEQCKGNCSASSPLISQMFSSQISSCITKASLKTQFTHKNSFLKYPFILLMFWFVTLLMLSTELLITTYACGGNTYPRTAYCFFINTFEFLEVPVVYLCWNHSHSPGSLVTEWLKQRAFSSNWKKGY